MKRFKMMIKAALIPAIIALIGYVIGIPLFGTGLVINNTAMIIAGAVLLLVGITLSMITYWIGRDKLRSVCPECQKSMAGMPEVQYAYDCRQYKENYDSNTGKLKDCTFYFTCQILCPHCGNTAVFEHKINAKTEPKAEKAMNDYLKTLLKNG